MECILPLCRPFKMAAPISDGKIELGFIEKSEIWRLTSPFFPSKVGGRPSWLSLTDLPNSSKLLCGNCGKPVIFLLQIYCPVDAFEGTFHRTLFLFICKDSVCHSQNSNKPFIVFRSQLPRVNSVYNFEPIEEESVKTSEFDTTIKKFGINLCVLCGCNAGNKKCSKCHTTFYCSKEHQLIHWKGGHKTACCKDGVQDEVPNILFPENEIVTESEPSLDEQQRDETEALTKQETDSGYSAEELEKMALKETKEDKHFLSFKDRIGLEPEQVLRYQRGGDPLWVSHNHQPAPTDIPACQCGSRRIFEFQVMPQMLIHLEVDKLDASIDWGTLAVYTCEANCNEGEGYHAEFLWKQDYEKSSDSKIQDS